MESSEYLVLIEQSQIASFFRTSRWGYACLSACHILGIALLVGATIPLNLRLLGRWPAIERRDLAHVLVPVAATGLIIAVATGLILFSVRATEYAALTIFWVKMNAVLLGGLSAITAHARYGIWFQATKRTVLLEAAAVSFISWITALFAGRLIAFSD